MVTAKMTAKRQVTFPVEVCRELKVEPGDDLVFEHLRVGEEAVWVIRTKMPDTRWMGSLRKYAKGKSMNMDDIRGSIARGRNG